MKPQKPFAEMQNPRDAQFDSGWRDLYLKMDSKKREEKIKRFDRKTMLQVHFFHEIRMLKEDFIFLIDYNKKISPSLKDLINYSYFTKEISEPVYESFLVHIRNLYEFFYGGNKIDRVYANDFKIYLNLKKTKDIKKIMEKISSTLSHLSCNRLNSEYKEWNPEKMFLQLKDLIIKFLDKVPKDWLNEDLKKIKREFEELNYQLK